MHRLARIVKPALLCPYITVSSQEDVQQKVELSLYVALDSVDLRTVSSL